MFGRYAAEFYLFHVSETVMQSYHTDFGSVWSLRSLRILFSYIAQEMLWLEEQPPFSLIPFGAVARGENPHLHLAQT